MHHIRDREHRFVVPSSLAASILRTASARLPLLVYEADRPVSFTRTTYLDMPDQRYLRSYRRGAATRLRVRQYAAAAHLMEPPVITSGAYLELKRSAGAERDKVRLELSVEALEALMVGRPDEETLTRLAAIDGLGKATDDFRSGLLAPRMMTWYRRLSLAGDGIRVTFDEAIAYAWPEPPLERDAPAWPKRIQAREPGSVLEVKLRRPMPHWLRRGLRDLGGGNSHSKYRAGMAALVASRAARNQGTVPLPMLG